MTPYNELNDEEKRLRIKFGIYDMLSESSGETRNFWANKLKELREKNEMEIMKELKEDKRIR